MADKLPEFQRQEKLSPTMIQGGFSEAMSSFALSNNQLTELGANVAQGAANARAEVNGYELGQNPVGDLLPPITATDKAFVASYHSSANATLSLQGNQAFAESQLSIAKMPVISQGNIDDVMGSMSKTAASIVEHAPTAIKGALTTSLGNQMVSTNKNLQVRLISQEREAQKDDANVYMQQTMTGLYQHSYDGDEQAAAQDLESLKKTVEGYVGTNILTKKQAFTAIRSAESSLLSGQISGEAVRAENQGEGNKYLADLATRNIPGLNIGEQNDVKKKALDQVKFVQSLKVGQENEVTSNVTKLFEEGKGTPDDLERLHGSVSKKKYDDTITKIHKMRGTEGRAKTEIAAARKAFYSSNIVAFNGKTINAAYAGEVQSRKEAHPDETDLQAEAHVLSAGNTPVPLMTAKVANIALHGGAQEMNNMRQLVDTVHKANASNLPLDTKTSSLMALYAAAVDTKDPNKSDQEVLDEVRKAIINKTPEQIEATNKAYNSFVQTSMPTDTDKANFGLQLFDIGSDSLSDMPGATLKAQKLFELNFKELNGNTQLAIEETKKQLQNGYGFSSVGGEKKYVWMAPTKVLKLPEEATPIIQAQVAQNLAGQIQQTNDGFAKGTSPFKYEITNAPDVAGALAAKLELSELSKNKSGLDKFTAEHSNRAQELKIKLESFQKNGPAKITRTDASGVSKTYTLDIKANSQIGLSATNTNQKVGDWEIKMVDDKGTSFPITGIGDLMTSNARYRADSTALNAQSSALLGINPKQNQSYADAVKEWELEQNKPERSNEQMAALFAGQQPRKKEKAKESMTDLFSGEGSAGSPLDVLK